MAFPSDPLHLGVLLKDLRRHYGHLTREGIEPVAAPRLATA